MTENEFPNQPESTAKRLLRDLFEKFPLYRALKLTSKDLYRVPEILNLYCGQNVCSSERLFELESIAPTVSFIKSYGNSVVAHFGFTHSVYKCRNCGAYRYHFLLEWKFDDGKSTIRKCGQNPAQETRIDPVLARHLGKSGSEFLEKGQRCRTFSFGLAAVSYVRRVVEDRMNALLDLLKEEKLSGWTAEELEEFEAAKTSWQFSRKLEYAAELLPAYLRPGGENPLARLHDLTSDGLHNKSEDECIEIFDLCIAVLTFVFREMELHRSGAEEYKKAIKLLTRSTSE